jgi:hypothetical protein
MVSDEAVVWLPIQMTLIHRFPGITVFKYCRVGASNLTPILPNVSSERTCRVRSRLLFKKGTFSTFCSPVDMLFSKQM